MVYRGPGFPLTLWWPENRLGSENRRWPQSHPNSRPRCERTGKSKICCFLLKLGFATDSEPWGGISWGTRVMRRSSHSLRPPDERNNPLGTKSTSEMVSRTRILESARWAFSFKHPAHWCANMWINKEKKTLNLNFYYAKVRKRFNYKRHIWISHGRIHPLWCKFMQRKINVRILQLLW